MPTYIWLDHDTEDPRQIIVNAPSVEEARSIVETNVIAAECMRIELENEARRARGISYLVTPDNAKAHIRGIIKEDPTELQEGGFFYEGYFYDKDR